MTITADLIAAYEDAGPRLTPTERASVDRYNHTIDGYADCFPLTTEDIASHLGEFGLPATLGMIDSHFRMLGTWREAIDTLYVDLRTGVSPEPGPHATSIELITFEGHTLTSMVTLTREAVCKAFVGTAGPETADDGRVVVAGM